MASEIDTSAEAVKLEAALCRERAFNSCIAPTWLGLERLLLGLAAERDDYKSRWDTLSSVLVGKTGASAILTAGTLTAQRDAAQSALREREAEVARLREAVDDAYLERNRVVALLASMVPAVRCRTAIEGWSDDWCGCVYLTLPTGQASWHYHDSHAHLFAHVPEGAAVWDGHSTDEKYERVAQAAYHYLGPLILSADHAAAVEAAVQAERDACRAEAADEKRNWSPDGVAATACEAIDRRIRARGPTDALAAELAKAREEWRELAVKAAECIERLYTINMTPAPDGAAMKTAAALRALAQEAPSDER